MSEVDDTLRSIAAARRRRTRLAMFAIAAAVLFALAVPGWRTPARRPVASRVEEVTTAFMPLPYSSVPAYNVQMVRLAVPRAALASFGLVPLESLDRASTDTVVADVLVGGCRGRRLHRHRPLPHLSRRLA